MSQITINKRNLTYIRGEIINVDFGEGSGVELSGYHDCVVVQNNMGNLRSTTLIVVPIVKSLNAKYEFDTLIKYNGKSGVAKSNMVTVIDKIRVKSSERVITKCVDEVVDKVIHNLSHNSYKSMYSRFDVLYVELSNRTGSEQEGNRPVLLLQNNVGNHFSKSLVVIPLTSSKSSIPTHCKLNKDEYAVAENSVLMFEQITTIDKSRVIGKKSTIELSEDKLKYFLKLAL